jgi:hypothetical protein
VAAGWENLRELDIYLAQAATAQPGLIVSVLDISYDFKTKIWPNVTNERDLARFVGEEKRTDASKVRLYMAEFRDTPSSSFIEALGRGLKLDPKFFIWCTKSKGHIFTPSQAHRAPFINFGFGVLDSSTPQMTDAEKFKVSVYIKVSYTFL